MFTNDVAKILDTPHNITAKHTSITNMSDSVGIKTEHYHLCKDRIYGSAVVMSSQVNLSKLTPDPI